MREIKNNNSFEEISISLVSPEEIQSWSSGEVMKPETINYRTQRSERQGLFDEKIFGPEKDYECYCGKYRGIRYKGIVCEKCGVEITRSIVRRERMGHIELCTPVSHVWFLKSIPSRISLLLGLKSSDVEKVVYFAGHIVTKVNTKERDNVIKQIELEYKNKLKTLKDDKAIEKLKEIYLSTKKEVDSIALGAVLDDNEHHKFSVKYGGLFETAIGAEAIYNLFSEINLAKLLVELEEKLENCSASDRPKLIKRVALVKGMMRSNIRPEWMFLRTIPVIPPALRPMVALDGGRHATSDINDLYRRVINRNNRLKKLLAIHAPVVILRNEKRILQEAVDALIDNSIRRSGGGALNQAQRRPLKSISANLKGKQGILRSNLLGKRVDYSARSVIVVGPSLSIDQCGLPKHMALELFRPFVIAKLLERELAFNIRGAGRLIDEGVDEVWAILEEVIDNKYVLLNRAPTLHRLGIQAFRPVLIEGNAIQVHPMVCSAYNADFDGDQMAVHLPLSVEAQYEAREIMSSAKNLLKPGDGKPHVEIGKDIILGCFWMTEEFVGGKGEGKYFQSPNAAISAYDFGAIDFRAKIKVLGTDSVKYAEFEGKPFDTTVGRLLFNSNLPSDFPYINERADRKFMATILKRLMGTYSLDEMPKILDKLKATGFKYATVSGVTWGLDDVREPEEKKPLVAAAKKQADEIVEQYQDGLLSDNERRRKIVSLWTGVKTKLEKEIVPNMLERYNPIHDLVKSGARGSVGQVTNITAMKGLIQGMRNQIIEFPILNSSKTGLTPLEYFTTTHGSRKGLSDTALNTAKAGYLTRRLFVVAQDVVISEEDCGTKDGVTISEETLAGLSDTIGDTAIGRYTSTTIKDEKGDIVFKRNHLVTQADAKLIDEIGIDVEVRSPMTCNTIKGICQKCYGIDLGNSKLIALGEAVGTVAAQTIGEPATQLTMRTFHAGGTASEGGDITAGLPRVEEIFERRTPKNPAVISRINGIISDISTEGGEKVIRLAPTAGEKSTKTFTEYSVHPFRTILVREGDSIEKGQIMTDGSLDLTEYYKYAGLAKTQEYIIREVSKIYELQAASIGRKHIEVIVRQMFSRGRIKGSGDTTLIVGDSLDLRTLDLINSDMKAQNKTGVEVLPYVSGITEISLTNDSFLSAASFQNTTRVLISAAVKGSHDNLSGLMENVIIGRLIPAGTGFAGSAKNLAVAEITAVALEADRQKQLEIESAPAREEKE